MIYVPDDYDPYHFDPQPKKIPRLSLIQRVGRILGKKESRRSCSTPIFNNEDGFMAQIRTALRRFGRWFVTANRSTEMAPLNYALFVFGVGMIILAQRM